jgi:hypothetical protein
MVAGYDYGNAAQLPMTCSGVDWLAATACFLGEHADSLRGAGAIPLPHGKVLVDGWLGIIASHVRLARSLFGSDGKPHEKRVMGAWAKAITRSVIPWALPYTKDELR